MKKIGSYQAKTNLPKLLDKVRKGEGFTITKHGVPVAQLIPISGASRKNIQSTIEKIEKFSSGKTLGDLKVRDLIKEGRKY